MVMPKHGAATEFTKSSFGVFTGFKPAQRRFVAQPEPSLVNANPGHKRRAVSSPAHRAMTMRAPQAGSVKLEF